MFTNWLTSPTTTATTSTNQSSTSHSNSINMGQSLQTNLMSTPPDIILEVGPQPSVRFVAHSKLLALHSGYLRSAIRIDENNINLNNNCSGSNIDVLSPIYLTNVTPEQFGPLLSYMYTGYLDLTVENIFGVLLATHVLHMPRALEICRSFLSRTQANGYLNSGFLNQTPAATNISNQEKQPKIIRPIPSKPLIPNLGFIMPPMHHNISLPTTGTQFRSLLIPASSATCSTFQSSGSPSNKSDIIPTKSESSSSPIEPVKSPSPNRSDINPENKKTVQEEKSSSKSKRRHSSTDSKRPSKSLHIESTNIVRKDLINQDTENKIIVDVASCDGPVRFKRVLNDAYGKQPDAIHLPIPSHERSHQSVSFSFHQQMAKNISQQRNHNQLHQSEESENSEDLKHASGSGEIFNCVYCKHTFKSQYCYQKHAKRHLNPLSLEQGEGIILAPQATTFNELLKNDDKLILSSRSTTPIIETASSASRNIVNESKIENNKNLNTKREVRPLDMNVQYYPCKTCGSKFPSYYFVHKHRKLCHANEEN